MIDYCVYVLYSESAGKLYIGFSENSIQRFYWHNFKSVKGFTTRYRPWKMTHIEFLNSKPDALVREKQLKGGQGRYWIRATIIPILKSAGFISA